MTDLCGFILARLDEDEAAAKAALDGWPPREAMSIYPPLSASTITRAMTAFFARHDPARVLREVATWRRLILEYQTAMRGLDAVYGGTERETGFQLAMSLALNCKASEYRDHQDYQQEWRP